MEIGVLLNLINQAAYEVRQHLSPGYNEIIYKKALEQELQDHGLNVQREAQLDVVYKGDILGHYYADIMVENKVILEVKATTEHSPDHERQLINYLTTTGIEDGILINYGTPTFVFRHKTRHYTSRHSTYGLNHTQSNHTKNNIIT